MTNRELLPQPKSAAEAMSLADMLSKSTIIPKSFQGKPSDIFVAMMWSHTLGIPVIQGLQSIAVVNGRPTLFGDGALAVCMASGLVEDISETVTQTKEDGLTAVCEVRRKGRKSPTIRQFTQSEAQKAGLWSKTGPWLAYPKRMLQMRARAYALRDCFPDVLSGMGVFEEQSDVVDTVAESEPKERKMPRRKSASIAPQQIENNPSPTAEEIVPPVIEGKTPAEVLAEVAEPAELDETADVAEESDPYGIGEIKAKIAACATVNDLMALYRSVPPAVRGGITADFSARKAEILNGAKE